ncbi:MAG: hypothetical protein HFE35_01965 [Clostridia bacterium]|nr:hypothetical protein [Clostridia bacterium]
MGIGMEGKEAIIAEIISKAERAAAGLISDAKAERDAALEKVRAEEARKREEALAEARSAAAEIASRAKTLSSLEARKTELAAKQRVLDAAFEEASKKILNMTDHIYREFIGGFIEKYADDGDSVIVAERDKKRLHAEWLKSLGDKCGKRLSLSEKTHGGNGGIILSGKTSDKNLTLETMFASLRDTALTNAAKRLFK